MLQQVFVPASKGLIKSAPSSLIPDGSFQEALNVRFKDGYVEKVEGFRYLFTLPNEDRVMKIHLFKKKDGTTKNIMHTKTATYLIEELDGEPVQLTDNTYKIADFGHISGVNAFDEYFFTSLGTQIMYWNDKERQAKVLEGTFDPEEWIPNHSYVVGDIVKPTYDKYSGFIYKCVQEGVSGEEEPEWTTNLIDELIDGDTKWLAVGSLEVEGQTEEAVSIRAQCIETFKGFLFIANTTEGGRAYPTRLRWSQWQNPRMWHNNEDGSGMCGYVDIDDTDGKIVALKRIGDALYIYKENSIIMLTYTGDPDNIFSKEVVTTKAGLISEDAIVELPHMNIFIGQDNIYQFDGNTCVPIADDISDWFFQEMLGQQEIRRIFGYFDEKNQEVVFCFRKRIPSQEDDFPNTETQQGFPTDATFRTNNDYGLIYNTKLRNWSLREMNVTAMGKYKQTRDIKIDDVNTQFNDQSNNVILDSAMFIGERTYTVVGDKDGNIYVMTGYTDERKPNGYEAYVVTQTHHMQEPGRIKRLMRIQFHIETVPTEYDIQENETEGHCLYCQVGTTWNPETKEGSRDIQWSAKQYLNLKRPVPWYTHHVVPYLDFDLSSRYFVIRFGTEGNGTYFKVLGYTLYYQVRSDE